MSYAEGTDVPVNRSREEVERLLKKAGAVQFFAGEAEDRFVVGCKMEGRLVRFTIPIPTIDDSPKTCPDKYRQSWADKEILRRWRCLVLSVKAKLSAVETGFKSFEEEFLADVVMADNRTVYEHIRDGIADSYSSGKVKGPLLLGPGT
jgi:hypothetical protein